jgi:serine protease Do
MSHSKLSTLYIIIITLLLGSAVGSFLGYFLGQQASKNLVVQNLQPQDFTPPTYSQTPAYVHEETVAINVVKKASPAVVSIIVTKDLPKVEKYILNPFGGYFPGYGIPFYKKRGYEKKTIGGGTGFLVTNDGYIVTNRHVVDDTNAEYTVLLNDKRRFKAKVLARYKLNDVAILKIEGKEFPTIALGDSNLVEVGQSAIAIGNSLGEFQNTVSKGVISGLSRSISSGENKGYSQYLFDLIQTDAAINVGNSGGPLINLSGEVIGINTAIVYQSQNIGFAIPINSVKNIIENVYLHGRIIRAFLGVRYVHLNDAIVQKFDLPINYGAMVIGGRYQSQGAVVPGSPADKAGLKEYDIITKVNDTPVIETKAPLYYLISQLSPTDTIELTIMRKGKEQKIKLKLEEMR